MVLYNFIRAMKHSGSDYWGIGHSYRIGYSCFFNGNMLPYDVWDNQPSWVNSVMF